MIVPDMRGFGNSDQPADPASYADAAMARDVAALIEHLGLESVDVCGFSMGSLTAAKLLALGPAAVRSAVLAGVGDDILEGEVMDLPQQWPLPEHLPRPLTLRAHAEEGTRLLDRGEVERDNLLAAQVIVARATGADPRVLAAVFARHDGRVGPARGARSGASGSGAQRTGRRGQPVDPALGGGHAAGTHRRVPGRSRIDALRAVVPARSGRLLRDAVAGPCADVRAMIGSAAGTLRMTEVRTCPPPGAAGQPRERLRCSSRSSSYRCGHASSIDIPMRWASSADSSTG